MKKNLKLTALAGTFLLLNGCSQTQLDLSSKIDIPTAFSQQQAGQSQQNIQQWWQNWQDPQLNRLIEQGLKHNLDLALAKARLAEAQAQSRMAKAELGTKVGITGSASTGYNNLNTGIINPNSSHSHALFGGLTASWEPDFFGQKRSDRDAAEAVALSEQQQVYAAQLLITAQIAESYFTIYAIEQQQSLLKQQINALQQLQRYLTGRFQAGQINAYEQQEVAKQISGAQAQQATLQAQRDSIQRQLATLTGQSPQHFRLQAQGNPLVNLPAIPTGQLPAEVLARRPDLSANAQQIQAAAAKLASAKADLLPRFDLQFLGQGGRIDVNNDLSYLSGIGSFLSLGIQLPLFTNGRIQANIDASDARLQQALIQYDKTLLTALAEVDNAYQQQYALRQQNQKLNQALQQAQQQSKDAKRLFQYGDQTFNNTISAQLSVLHYQQQLIQSQLETAKSLLGLYKALGGGWVEEGGNGG